MEGKRGVFTRRADAAHVYGVVQLGDGIQDDAFSLHHCTLQQAELLLLQLLGQLAFTTGLICHTDTQISN